MEKNKFVKKLICPECGKEIEYTGADDYDCGGGHYYYAECEDCEIEFRVYEEENGYDLWYEVWEDFE